MAVEQPAGKTIIVTDPASKTLVVSQPDRSVVLRVGGVQGPSPSVSVYDTVSVTPSGGKLTLDFKHATTFFVNLTADVDEVELLNPPIGRSQRIAIYFVQDAVGGRVLTGWPAQCRWPSGTPPALSPQANAIDLVVVDAVAGLYFGALVALDYR